MGQRHQIFIKTHNPNFGRHKKHIGTFENGDFKEDSRTKKALGGRKYTVLAYHHQWLYGLSAAHNVHKLMFIAKSFDEASEYSKEYNHPLAEKFDRLGTSTLEDTGLYYKALMGVVTDPEFPRGIGFERFLYLNPEEPIMREDFTMGDNNDGVTIVDMIEKKYCLMNISSTNYADEGDVSENVDDLPYLTPVSAVDYARAYYPTEKDKLSKYTKEKRYENDPQKIEEHLKSNREAIEKIEKMFEGMEVLSLEEVKAIFPKVFKEETVNTK